MEWLTNLLGMANQGTSPFGALGGGYSGPTGDIGFGAGVGVNGPIPATPSPAPSGTTPQFPGLIGRLINAMKPAQPGQSGDQSGQQQGQQAGNQQMTPQQQWLLQQSLGLMKGPQMQQPQWMHLLSGPRS